MDILNLPVLMTVLFNLLFWKVEIFSVFEVLKLILNQCSPSFNIKKLIFYMLICWNHLLFFFFLFFFFHRRYASFIRVAASAFFFSMSSQRCFRSLSASKRASSLFLSSSISKKCLFKLFNSSETLFNYFSAFRLVPDSFDISISYCVIISIKWV